LENAANYGGGATVISVTAVRIADGSSRRCRERGGRIGATTPTVVEIAVDDAGPGISPIERTKVFERFYRGSASGRRGTGTGTGLGLALVAEHVRLMHGEVLGRVLPLGRRPLRRHPARLPKDVTRGQDW
jgi:signal transduction histidine kinase